MANKWQEAMGVAQSAFGELAKAGLPPEDFQKTRQTKSAADVYKDFEAQEKFSAFQKMNKGQPLTPSEMAMSGQTPPTELNIWKQAQSETLQNLGGSQWQALSSQKQAMYYPAIEQRYYDLKKQFGVIQPNEQLIRAKNHLKQQGYLATDDTATLFLQKNPNF